MNLLNKRSRVVDAALIIVGTLIMGLGIKCIYDQMGMVTGGFSGIAIIARKLTETLLPGGVPLGVTNLILNIPVFILAYKIKGKQFIGKTILATVFLSVWLSVLPDWDLSQGDFVLSAIFGGAIAGVGMGLVLLAKATTGGTDMVAAIIQHKMKHYSIVQIMQVIDGAVVVIGCYIFGLKAALYAIVAILITTKVSDAIMEGMKYSKGVYIISEHSHEIAKEIFKQLDRGVTGLAAKGMYSGNEKCMLYCVVSKKQIVELKDLVNGIDPKAFVIVSDVREVLGEGFIEYKED
ncbi:MAG: YitT family protein [Eubacterium sp.]|jgi:uncharacterized membrane-anchored protein YitT (DUF2179 family)|nr:YitT family protein [Eubacterium sp.]